MIEHLAAWIVTLSLGVLMYVIGICVGQSLRAREVTSIPMLFFYLVYMSTSLTFAKPAPLMGALYHTPYPTEDAFRQLTFIILLLLVLQSRVQNPRDTVRAEDLK